MFFCSEFAAKKIVSKMKRIKSLLLVFICVLCILFDKEVYGDTDSVGELYSLSAVLMDGDSGRILYEKEGNVKRPMASTTKIMTCIIALEYGKLDSIAKVSKYAASMPDVQLNIKEGQRFMLKDLLYSLMLESHNDSAVVIAECVAGSVEEFAVLMNNKAMELGCKDTYFITPNGLDASEGDGEEIKIHSTTARDLAKIMSYCLTNEMFINITQTLEYSFNDKKIEENGDVINGSSRYNVINRNTLLKTMEGIITGKTGFTSDAGYCYVCAYENEGRTYIIALLGCGWPNNKNYKWVDTKRLLKYGRENYQLNEIKYKNIQLPGVKVENGIYGNYYDFGINGIMDSDDIYINGFVNKGEMKLLLKSDEYVRTEIKIPKSIEAPVKRGQVIGSVKYIIGNNQEKEIDIYAAKCIEKKDFVWSFGVVFMKFVLY